VTRVPAIAGTSSLPGLDAGARRSSRAALSFLLAAACVVAAGCGDGAVRAAASGEGAEYVGNAVGTTLTVDTTRLGAMPRDSLDALGAAAYGDERYEEARAIWEVGLKLARVDGDAVVEAHLLTSLGLTAWRLGQFERAQRLEREALRVERRAGLLDLFPRTYNALGLIAWDQGRFSDARDWYDSTFAAAEAAGDEGYHAKALVNLGNVETALGEVESARRLMHRGLETFRALEMPDMVSRTLVNLAALERDAGNLEQALEWAEQGLALARAAGDGVGEEAALGQIASLHMRLGNHEEALAAVDSALRQARRHGLRQAEAADLEILADLHHGLGDLQRALRLYDSARVINAELALQVEVGLDLYRLAAVHAALGNHDVARESGEAALETHRAVGASLPALADLLLLAEIAELSGDPERADAHLEEAARRADRLGLRSGRLEVALATARVADRRADDERVLAVLDEVKGELPLGGFAAESEAGGLRARALRGRGELAGAEEAGRGAIALVQGARDELASGLLRSTFVHSRAGLYGDLADILFRQHRMEEAFEVAVAAGSMKRAGASARGQARREVLLERMGALTAQVRALERDYPENPDLTREPVERLQAARLEYAELTERDASPAIDAGDIRSALDPDEALLQFLVGDEQVFAFLVTPGSVRVARLEVNPEDLATRVRLARRLLENPTDGDPSPMLAALYSDLIGRFRGAEDFDSADRLILVPHGPLTYLPFAALRDDRSGRWLAEQKTLAHLPSATLLIDRTRAAAGRGGRAHAFAPLPVELPASPAEVRAVGRALGPGTRIEIGDGATEYAVRAALGAGGVVHVASHAELNPANPMLSAVVLAAPSSAAGATGVEGSSLDGRLEVHELLDLPIRSPLVFLSGCETGLGAGWRSSYAVGEDFATLERVLLEAGADGVVATLWRIVDESAAELASRFYAHVGDTDPASALAAAQREMIAHPRFAHPSHWAAYRASGAGR